MAREPKIISVSGQVTPGSASSDEIEPASIIHVVDDLRQIGVDQVYNYLVYQFRRDEIELSARAYVTEMDEVTVLTVATPTDDPARRLAADVASYLKRRFKRVLFLHDRVRP